MRKVAILGTSPTWKDAPFDDETWEIWSCNAPALDLQRCDRIFEIHQRWWDNDEDNEYLRKLRAVKAPRKVYSIVPIGGSENIVMDRKALFKKYGVTWFSSSFGYMIGQAFEEKIGKIGLWGVDMESREEYIVQQAGVRHWIDLAPFVDIEIYVPDDSLLRREPVPYPDRFETVQALAFERKARRIHGMLDKAEQGLEKAKRTLYFRIGYLDAASAEKYPSDIRRPGENEDRDIMEARWNVERWVAHVARLKGELFATQHYKRLFVWNVIDPDLGEESAHDVEDCGPI